MYVGTTNLRAQLFWVQKHPWHSKTGSGSLQTILFRQLQSYLAFSQNSILCTNGAIPFLSLGGHPDKSGHVVRCSSYQLHFYNYKVLIQKSSMFELTILFKVDHDSDYIYISSVSQVRSTCLKLISSSTGVGRVGSWSFWDETQTQTLNVRYIYLHLPKRSTKYR